MPIDPTAALAVNIVSAPRCMAFFLGAGVSAAAGIPTGGQILQDTCQRYYLAVNAEAPAPNLDVVKWAMEDLGEETVTYSALLERVFPSPAARQEYLRQFFEGREPTDAHRALASLAKGGWVRVFVTTNFDHLMEKALDQAGVSWSRVSSPEELKTARPRELCDTYILKVHGDYTASSIRNTSMELEALDPELAQDLRQILLAYGLVAIGYSGQDAGVARILKSERARYGVYWTIRGEAPEPLKDLLTLLDSRRIDCIDSDSFCKSLELRVQALSQHHDGRTPANHRAEIIALMRRGDAVGIRQRGKDLSDRLYRTTVEFGEHHRHTTWAPAQVQNPGNYESWLQVVNPVLEALGPGMDAFLSCAIAAGEFQNPDYTHFLKVLPRMFSYKLPGSGATLALEVSRTPAVLVGFSLLVAALATDSWKMFTETALLMDLERGIPWSITPSFHHVPLIHYHPRLSGNLVLDWISRSAAMKEVIPGHVDLTDLAAQASILLCISARSRGQKRQPSYFWGFGFYGSRVEPLIRRIVYDSEVAGALSPLVGGDAAQFKREFHAHYTTERDREVYFEAVDGVRRDVLDLLLQ